MAATQIAAQQLPGSCNCSRLQARGTHRPADVAILLTEVRTALEGEAITVLLGVAGSGGGAAHLQERRPGVAGRLWGGPMLEARWPAC